MATVVIRNPNDDRQIALYEFVYSHASCPSGAEAMKWSREQVNDIVSLTCVCGLEVSFPQFGPAASAIADVSIDGDSRELPAGSFESSLKKSVVIAAAAG
ncbi:MAG: hypothetical protein JNM58_02920 [Xanthomonadaceae bacterium]|nr:hypothetical protein [Xanthomonadaceae bacterium]